MRDAHITTGKMFFAVPTNTAVRQHISLPCGSSMMHGNTTGHGKYAIERTAKISARQRGSRAHAKKRGTVKSEASARQRNTARQRLGQRTAKKTDTAKVPLPCGSPLPCAFSFFSFFSFLFYSFYYLCLFLN
jgi:hypothetical protein